MADKIISDFTAATTVASGDLVEIETAAGNSRKVTGSNLAKALLPLAFYGTSAKLNADLTAINATATYAITWDGADEYDIGSWHDPASNNTRITPTGFTYYDAYLSIWLDSTLSTNQWVRLTISRRNSGGTLVNERESIFFVDSHAGSRGMTTVMLGEPMSAGDYFTASLTTESDNSITISNNYSVFRVIARG